MPLLTTYGTASGRNYGARLLGPISSIGTFLFDPSTPVNGSTTTSIFSGNIDVSTPGSYIFRVEYNFLANVKIWGAGGGGGTNGGQGGFSAATISFFTGRTYTFTVGATGGGQVRGSASNGWAGGGGGGGSAIDDGSNSIIVAGGGGGCSGYNFAGGGPGQYAGGAGGYPNGGGGGGSGAGGGGTQSAGGAGGNGLSNSISGSSVTESRLRVRGRCNSLMAPNYTVKGERALEVSVMT
jgi:hypothetical protein